MNDLVPEAHSDQFTLAVVPLNVLAGFFLGSVRVLLESHSDAPLVEYMKTPQTTHTEPTRNPQDTHKIVLKICAAV
ncbi:hypothetical protein N180_19390 [Pedobacter antarcticus 4BY]|uniref:Uncharacterized protein n=1 Tax=Pedobacter antarcticus 4BY TaxID=1358423 RepID=A0A081PDX9_9SPHI|nr:hypothetical protein N180_19390 [Pedobacter antarcticus 4BY]